MASSTTSEFVAAKRVVGQSHWWYHDVIDNRLTLELQEHSETALQIGWDLAYMGRQDTVNVLDHILLLQLSPDAITNLVDLFSIRLGGRSAEQ